MRRLNMSLPIWLKILACLILGITILILSAKLYGLYRIYSKYPKLVKALELGEQMISHKYVSKDCSYVDFNHFPELKQGGFANLGEPGTTYMREKYLKVDTQCIHDAKLIGIEYKYGHARATYTCEKADVITEVTWTDFENSCSYMKTLKSWNLPVGWYSLLSVNRP